MLLRGPFRRLYKPPPHAFPLTPLLAPFLLGWALYFQGLSHSAWANLNCHAHVHLHVLQWVLFTNPLCILPSPPAKQQQRGSMHLWVAMFGPQQSDAQARVQTDLDMFVTSPLFRCWWSFSCVTLLMCDIPSIYSSICTIYDQPHAVCHARCRVVRRWGGGEGSLSGTPFFLGHS